MSEPPADELDPLFDGDAPFVVAMLELSSTLSVALLPRRVAEPPADRLIGIAGSERARLRLELMRGL